MTGIQITAERIDPALARQYLDKNIEHNRSIAEWKVLQYAMDMAEGRWIPTSATIKFDVNGNLIDGQHRLLAIIEAGATVPMVVSRNEPVDAVHVIDTGMARTAGASLTVAQITTSGTAPQIAATANVLHAIENGMFRHAMSSLGRQDRLTNAQMVEYVRPRVQELMDANRMAGGVYSSIPMNRSVLAAAYIIFKRLDAEAADDFYEKMASGVSSGVGDPLLTLSRRVLADKINGRRTLQSTALFMLFRTWNAWRDGEEFTKMQVGSVSGGWVAMPVPH